jgi:putative ABC transport system substrate-binding protein
VNNRRKLVVALGVGPFAWAGAIFSQSEEAHVVIGWLSAGSRATQRRLFAAFKEGMAELGWKEGLNYVLEERWADGAADRVPGLAEELAATKPAIIVASSGAVIAAA